MSDLKENKLNAEELEGVTGGVGRQEIPELQVHPERPDRQDL